MFASQSATLILDVPPDTTGTAAAAATANADANSANSPGDSQYRRVRSIFVGAIVYHMNRNLLSDTFFKILNLTPQTAG